MLLDAGILNLTGLDAASSRLSLRYAPRPDRPGTALEILAGISGKAASVPPTVRGSVVFEPSQQLQVVVGAAGELPLSGQQEEDNEETGSGQSNYFGASVVKAFGPGGQFQSGVGFASGGRCNTPDEVTAAAWGGRKKWRGPKSAFNPACPLAVSPQYFKYWTYVRAGGLYASWQQLVRDPLGSPLGSPNERYKPEDRSLLFGYRARGFDAFYTASGAGSFTLGVLMHQVCAVTGWLVVLQRCCKRQSGSNWPVYSGPHAAGSAQGRQPARVEPGGWHHQCTGYRPTAPVGPGRGTGQGLTAGARHVDILAGQQGPPATGK